MVYNLFRIKKKRDVFEARLIKGGGKKPLLGSRVDTEMEKILLLIWFWG